MLNFIEDADTEKYYFHIITASKEIAPNVGQMAWFLGGEQSVKSS